MAFLSVLVCGNLWLYHGLKVRNNETTWNFVLNCENWPQRRWTWDYICVAWIIRFFTCDSANSLRKLLISEFVVKQNMLTPPIFQISLPLSFPKDEDIVKECPFLHRRRDLSKIAKTCLYKITSRPHYISSKNVWDGSALQKFWRKCCTKLSM